MLQTEVINRQKHTGSRSLLAEVKWLLGFTTKKEVEEQPSRGTQATAHKGMEISRQGLLPASRSDRGSGKPRTHYQNGNLTIVFSFLIGFFVSVSLLGGKVNEFAFWVTALIVGFFLWNLTSIAAGLYRMLPVLSLVFVLNTVLGGSVQFWPEPSFPKGTTKDTTVEVRSSAVKIREAPTTDSGIVFTAQQGDELKVIDKRGSWYKVRTWSGTTGWVQSNLVS
jgi:hypothetical protein